MENVLKARIVGDISDYKAKMAEAERITESATKEIVNLEGSLARLKAEYKAGSIDVDQYSKQLAKLNNQLQDQRQVSNNARGSMRAIGGDVNQATGTFQELNRVIQDAPFGIIGVGNNLQQLAGNFGQLSQQAGGTRAALALTFKSLVSGINPAILAVSAITTAFTLYNMGVFDSKEETESLTDALQKYRDTLDTVSRANIEGASSAEKELQTISLLRAQIDNENVSRKDKLAAVNELQSKYPQYLGNLSDEQILAGDVGSAYDELTKSIVATAKARAFSDEIAKNSLDTLTLLTQEEQRINEILNVRTKLESVQARLRGDQVLAIGDIQALSSQELLLQNELKNLVNEQLNSANERVKIESENLKLQDQISDSIFKGARFTKEATQSAKEGIDWVKEGARVWIENENNILNSIKAARSYEEALAKAFGGLSGNEGENPVDKIQEQIAQSLAGLESNFTETAPVYESIRKNNDVLINSFASLGGQIANAFGISNNALRGFVSTVLSSAPKIIQAINAQAQAKKAASASNVSSSITEASAEGVVIGTKAASALGPVGLALLPVFIGGALAIIQSAFGKGGGGGSSPTLGQGSSFTNRREFGGPVAAGRAYIVGEKRPEIFVPNTNGTIIPKMPDMNYGGMANGRASGMNVNLSGSFRIDKNDLLYVIEQGLVERRLT